MTPPPSARASLQLVDAIVGPSLLGISPSSGPERGGTMVYVSGQFLEFGSDIYPDFNFSIST